MGDNIPDSQVCSEICMEIFFAEIFLIDSVSLQNFLLLFNSKFFLYIFFIYYIDFLKENYSF